MRLLSNWSLLLQCSAAGMIRYTKKARWVVFHACEQALQQNSKQVTAEHLLVGLLRADQSLAAHCGLTIDRVRKELTKAPHGCRTTTGLALSNTAREAILLAAEERERFGHKHTGTEHLLLGIIRGSSDAAKMLERRGLTIDRARELVSQRTLAVGWENVESALATAGQLP